jgi:serine/threonine-protein kinase
LVQEDLQASTTPAAEAPPPSLPSRAANVPTAPNAQNPLPDADTQGFLNYQGAARCRGVDPAALIVRTPESEVVICQSGPASFYYRGLRLSDGGNMELAGATPTASGFSVTNPSDGTEYDVSQSGLVIHWNGKVYTESAIESAP